MRRVAPATAALVLVSVGILAGGCGDPATTLAQQACTHVHSSIRLYHDAERTTSAKAAAAQVNRAYEQLRDALPLAAQATSADGRWNALMTAISESARVSEGNLITALDDECAVASAGSTDQSPAAPPAPANQAPSSPAPTSVQNGY